MSFSIETLYNLHRKISGPLTVWLRLDRRLRTEGYNLLFLSVGFWCWTTSYNSLPAAYELNKTKTETQISFLHLTLSNTQIYIQSNICYFFFPVLTCMDAALPYGEAEKSGKHQADVHPQDYTLTLSFNGCVGYVSAQRYPSRPQMIIHPLEVVIRALNQT